MYQMKRFIDMEQSPFSKYVFAFINLACVQSVPLFILRQDSPESEVRSVDLIYEKLERIYCAFIPE